MAAMTVLLLALLLLVTQAAPIASRLSPSNFTSLIAPIYIDPSSLQYTLILDLSNHSFLLDLGGDLLWSACSSHQQPKIPCNSYQCSAAKTNLSISCRQSSCSSSKKQRKKEACTIWAINPISPYASCINTEMSYTKLNMTTFNGVHPLSPLPLPKVMSACAPSSLLTGLPENASGVVGLGRSGVALPAQLAATVGFSSKFALCPSAYSFPGVAFFGDGPYEIMPFPSANLDGESILEYAPLKTNPSHPHDYYVPVKEINVLGTKVAVNGWTKLSPSTTPYTTMATPLYKTIAAAFLRSVTQVPPPMKPFELCGLMWEYSTEMYPFLPIDLVMENGTVWTITPASAMKQPTEKSVCLAIFDGGINGENAIVIGSYQMQEVFSLFDLNRSSIGMSQHLTYYGWACENFYLMSK